MANSTAGAIVRICRIDIDFDVVVNFGAINTDANDVCRRLPESKGDLRTKRCTGLSTTSHRHIHLKSLPSHLNACNIPRRKLGDSGRKLTLSPSAGTCNNISAQSWASVPLEPDCISKSTRAVHVPLNMRRNPSPASRFSPSNLPRSRLAYLGLAHHLQARLSL